jgi:hypothetical protein
MEHPVRRMPSGRESETAASVERRTGCPFKMGVLIWPIPSNSPNMARALRDDDLNFVLGIEERKWEFQNGTTCFEEAIRLLSAIQN